jgi:hypothetical protein
LLREERQKLWLSPLGLLVSIGFMFFFEVKSTCFADARIVLLQEVLYTTYTHLDGFATNWAWHVSIGDNKIMIEILKASKHRQCSVLLWTYLCVITANPISRFWQKFHIA